MDDMSVAWFSRKKRREKLLKCPVSTFAFRGITTEV
jgi:hypothetical protein